MKNELLWGAIALYWLALIGLIGPALISAASTELVLAGFALFLVSGYASYRYIRKQLTKRHKTDAH